jgi:hypothetical protein
LPSVFYLALGKELLCRVPAKKHSANHMALGKEPNSGNVTMNHCNLLQLFLSCDNCFNYQMIMDAFCRWVVIGLSGVHDPVVLFHRCGASLIILVGVLNFNLSFCFLLESQLFLLWSFHGKCRVNYLFIIFVCFNI